MDILLTLQSPGHLIISADVRRAVERGDLRAGPPPWRALSDILITSRREFVGVVMYANANDMRTAQALADLSDPAVVRYLSPTEAAHIQRYRTDSADFAVLELCWSPIQPEFVEVAQLMDEWYYSSLTTGDTQLPIAYGYQGVEEIMEAYDLRLPDTVRP